MWLAWGVVAWAGPGSVTVPIEVWQQHTQQAVPNDGPAAAFVERRLTGKVERGRLVGELTLRAVASGGAVDLPLVANNVTLVDARLDGQPVVPRIDGPFATLRAEPGEHIAVIRFIDGAATERFSRTLDLSLPPGGPTALSLHIPEQPIDASLSSGLITSNTVSGEGTTIGGWLDASGVVSLTWARRAEHTRAVSDADLVARIDALVEAGEDVATGVARVAFDVRSGSVDHLRLSVPPGVEVLDASGPSVLQWYTAREGAGSILELLLREVIDDDLAVTVRFQYPVERGQALPVLFPAPPSAIPTSGVVGIEAPAGFEVTTTQIASASALEPRDVPRSVLDLSANPVRAAFSFDSTPDIALSVARQPELPVVTTRIDDLQAITVLVGDGGEIGKLRMTVRNTTRQVLTVDLPEGAHLTHCYRDGLPLRPATEEGMPSRVLVPLTRSEQQGPATHTVEAGDTLSGIALRYRGDGSSWRTIAAANPGIHPGALMVGTTLTIPASADGASERSFVLELAWERRASSVGALGVRTITAPRLDLEVMSADWHVYLPEQIEVVWSSTELQLDGHRDPLTRILDGLVLSTLPGDTAFAGGDVGYGSSGYSNILTSRRAIYEKRQKESVEQRTDPFPLVGRRYALHGTLLGTHPLSLSVAFLDRSAANSVRTALFLLSALALVAFAWRPQRSTAALLAAVSLSGVGLGFGLIGSWSQLLWGIDLGLSAVLCRLALSLPFPLKQRIPGLLGVLLLTAFVAACCGSPVFTLLLLLSGVILAQVVGRR